jgi:hypothetical protein
MGAMAENAKKVDELAKKKGLSILEACRRVKCAPSSYYAAKKVARLRRKAR